MEGCGHVLMHRSGRGVVARTHARIASSVVCRKSPGRRERRAEFPGSWRWVLGSGRWDPEMDDDNAETGRRASVCELWVTWVEDALVPDE